MLRVLTVSRKRGLLLTRNDALALAGFSVVSPRTPEEAPSLLNERPFDAVLIGDSVPPPERRKLIGEVRRRFPQTLICYIRALPDASEEPLADISVDESHGPEPMIAALTARLRGRERAA